MKVGDLVRWGDGVGCWERNVGIAVSDPRLSADCEPGGEAFPNESYHIVEVSFGNETITCFLDELEVISESR